MKSSVQPAFPGQPIMSSAHYEALANRLGQNSHQINRDTQRLLEQWQREALPVDVAILIALHALASVIKPQAGNEMQMIAACFAMLTDILLVGSMEPIQKAQLLESPEDWLARMPKAKEDGTGGSS